MAKLVVCVGCRRHVRSQETACPFCGARIHGSAGHGAGPILVASVVLATLAGCASTPPQPAESPTEIKVLPPEDKGQPTDTEPDPTAVDTEPVEPAPVDPPEDGPDPGPVMMYASPPR